MKIYALMTLAMIASLSSHASTTQYPKSIQQFCGVLERDILSYYQIEMDNNLKYTNNSLPQAERNQAREIAIAIKDFRIKAEESWQRIGCIQLGVKR
jgi:hypothetical protein